MSFYEENRQAIVSYFQQGSQNPLPCTLGVEVEHFIVRKKDNSPVYYEHSRRQKDVQSTGKQDTSRGLKGLEKTRCKNNISVACVLQFLSEFYPEKLYGLEGDLIGLASKEATLTLEPAAQLEISIAPFSSIEDIMDVYQAFRKRIDPFLAEYECQLVTLGYHPSAKALDLPLIPKRRYELMNEYFHALGTRGERMMRASASTQVSIDYADEADAIRKMRLAQALAPILSCIADNVAVFEGQPATRRLERFAVWRDVDNDRCGSVPSLFEDGYGFAQYAEWLLETSPIFVTRPPVSDSEGARLRPVGAMPAKEAYGDAPMTEADIEHLLSMFWPDVRLKKFVEIRPADSLEPDQVAGYVALIKGIFYSEEAMQALEQALGVVQGQWPFTNKTANETMDAIRKDGLQAKFAGLEVAEWVSLLFDQAKHHLNEADQSHLEKLTRWFYSQERNNAGGCV